MNRRTDDTRSDRDGLEPDGLSPLVRQWPDEAPPAWLDANIRAAAHDAARIAAQKAATVERGAGRRATPVRWNRWLPLGGTLATAVLAVLLMTARPGDEHATGPAEHETTTDRTESSAAPAASATPSSATPSSATSSSATPSSATPSPAAPAREEPAGAARESAVRTARPAASAARSATPAAKPSGPVAEPAAPAGEPAAPSALPAPPTALPAPPAALPAPPAALPGPSAAPPPPPAALPAAPAGKPADAAASIAEPAAPIGQRALPPAAPAPGADIRMRSVAPAASASDTRPKQDARNEDSVRAYQRRFEQQSASSPVPASPAPAIGTRSEPALPDSGEACVRLLESLSRERRSDDGRRMLTRCRDRFPDQPIPPSLEREFGGR